MVLDAWRGDYAGGDAAVREAVHRCAGSEDHDRDDSADRCRAVRDAGGGAEGEEQLAPDRGAAADCDVPGEAVDGGFAAGDREAVRGQTPYDGDALDCEDRRAAADGQGPEPDDQ